MNKHLSASQVRTFVASPRKWFFDAHVEPSASIHEELSKHFTTKP